MLALTLTALLIACPDPGKDKTAAVVTEPPKTTAPAPAPTAERKTLPAAGTISFVGAKVSASHPGSFSEQTTTFEVEGDKLVGVKSEVKLASGTTDAPKLDDHLKSPDFWDVANHPVATFTSTEIREGAAPDSKLFGATHTLVGDFTLRGTTKRIEVPIAVTVTPGAIAGKTEFSINRGDFAISYPGKADDLIAEAVLIKAELTATR